MIKRVGELGTWCANGEMSPEDAAEYNKFDGTITEAMKAAEKRLPKQRGRGWTAKINLLVHQIRYYRMLLRQINGTAMHNNVPLKVGELANLSWRSDGQKEADGNMAQP